MENKQIIANFYEAFSKRDIDTMLSFYHEDARFEDPAFGKLNAEQTKDMWTMLIQRSKGNMQIEHQNIQVEGDHASAEWIARYPFGKNQRPVVNHVKARFTFKEGKIIEHQDQFDVWRWSSQALGISGSLLGWTGFLKNKIQKQSLKLLKEYQANK